METTYPSDLPADVCQTLEFYRETNTFRLRLTYNGWTEEGYLSRTMGNPNAPGGGTKAAMLVHNRRSMGGQPLSRGIVKIETTTKQGRTVWERS